MPLKVRLVSLYTRSRSVVDTYTEIPEEGGKIDPAVYDRLHPSQRVFMLPRLVQRGFVLIRIVGVSG